MQIRKPSMGVAVNGIGDGPAVGWRSTMLLTVGLVVALSVAPKAEAQSVAPRAEVELPDAPSAIETAPLKRYSLNIGLESTYSLTSSLDNLTSKLAVSIRLGQRETLGFSFSHATAMNEHHLQNNSVVASLNFRAWSWGKIPRER